MGYWEQIAVENIRHAERRASMTPAQRRLADAAASLGWALLAIIAYAPLWLPIMLLIASWLGDGPKPEPQ